jgi:hypothetical protein
VAPSPIGEGPEDQDEREREDGFVRESVPQFDGLSDEEMALGEVSESDEDDEMVDDDDDAAKRAVQVEGVEAAEVVEEVAAVHGSISSEVDMMDEEHTQLDESAWWDGGAKKPSLATRVKKTGQHLLKRTQVKMGLVGKDKEVKRGDSESTLTMRWKARASKSAWVCY